MYRLHTILAIVWLMSCLPGCAEQTLIRTSPPDASVMINGKFIGVTPVLYRVPESEFHPHTTYQIARDGYEPIEGELNTYVTPGRIVGGIFTLGIPFIFRGATAFAKVHDFQLQPVARATVPAVPAEPPPPPSGSATVPLPSTSDPAASKLRQLQDLYDRGLISEEEYRSARSRIVRGL
jgi:hypothetical protein